MLLALAEVTLQKMGSCLLDEGLAAAAKGAALFGDLGDKRLSAACHLAAANARIKRASKAMDRRQESQLVLDASKDALQLFQEVKDLRGEAKSLHAAAVAYIDLQEFRQAIQLTKKAVRIFQELGDRKNEAFELRALARWHLRKEEPDQALVAAQMALEIFRELPVGCGGGGWWEALALGTVVQAHLACRDPDHATRAAKEGLARFQEAGNREAQLAALDMLRGAQLLKGNIEAARTAAEDALAIARDLQDGRCEAQLLLSLSQILRKSKEESSKAVEIAKEAQEILRDLELDQERASALQELSDLHLTRGEFREALRAAEEAKTLHESLGEKRGVATSYLAAGAVHHAGGRFPEAILAFEEALAIWRIGGDRHGEAQALDCLARALADAQDVRKALQVAAKCRSLLVELGDKSALLDLMLLIANLEAEAAREARLLDVRKPSAKATQELCLEAAKALQAAREAVALARRTGDAKTLVISQHTEIEVLIGSGLPEDAMRVINDALAVCRERRFEKEEGRLLADVAQVHLCRENVAKSTEAAEKALAMARKVQDAEGEEFALDILDHIESLQAAPRSGSSPAASPSQTVVVQAVAGKAPAQEQAAAANAPREYLGPSKGSLTQRIQGLMKNMFDAEDLENDTMLMDIGIDSLSMLDFHSRMGQEFPGVAWSTTMLFDFPTVGELTEMMDDTLRSAFENGAAIR